jgi:hypothetical protein
VFRRTDRLNYAKLAASLALFIALGGTATAAITLPRNSIGAREISNDAVRFPEIAEGGVRSSEIARDTVRSSEIRDSAILLKDISGDARRALRGAEGPAGPAGPQGPGGIANVRIAEEDFARVPTCDDTGLRACPNLVELSLGNNAPDAASDWLIQAKLVISSPDGTSLKLDNRCGLFQPETSSSNALVDDVRLGRVPSFSAEVIALSGVVTERARNPLMALRCSAQTGEELDVEDMTITAIEVGTLTGP